MADVRILKISSENLHCWSRTNRGRRSACWMRYLFLFRFLNVHRFFSWTFAFHFFDVLHFDLWISASIFFLLVIVLLLILISRALIYIYTQNWERWNAEIEHFESAKTDSVFPSFFLNFFVFLKSVITFFLK